MTTYFDDIGFRMHKLKTHVLEELRRTEQRLYDDMAITLPLLPTDKQKLICEAWHKYATFCRPVECAEHKQTHVAYDRLKKLNFELHTIFHGVSQLGLEYSDAGNYGLQCARTSLMSMLDELEEGEDSEPERPVSEGMSWLEQELEAAREGDT